MFEYSVEIDIKVTGAGHTFDGSLRESIKAMLIEALTTVQNNGPKLSLSQDFDGNLKAHIEYIGSEK